jgi:mRNA interferase RelE/StbE
MTDSYRIEISKSADRDIRKIEVKFITPIFEAIKNLSDNPYPPQSGKLKGSENSYRLRVGNYRILYEINHKEKSVIVFHIRHRSEAYRK